MKHILKFTPKKILTGLAGLATALAVTGCTTADPRAEPAPVQTLTFASVREEIRMSYDTATLVPATNRFVFPVAYRIEGTATLNELQMLFDRYQTTRGRKLMSIHDNEALPFLEVMDTLGGTILPDLTIREEDVRTMTPLVLESWLKIIRGELGISSEPGSLPVPRP
jgi:hypothetical protein